METTQLSKKRNITLPKTICDSYHLDIGQEIEIEMTPEGILLKPKTNAQKTNIDDIAGCLAYQSKAKTIEEMNEGIKQGIIEKWGKHDSH